MKLIKDKVWNRMNFRKGFTLVELIVVLGIMEILAAISVPALTRWIDKAKEKQVKVHAGTVWLAAQTVMEENHAGAEYEDAAEGERERLTVTKDCMDEDSAAGAIARLADIKTDYLAEITVENGTVTGLIFTPQSGEPVSLGISDRH